MMEALLDFEDEDDLQADGCDIVDGNDTGFECAGDLSELGETALILHHKEEKKLEQDPQKKIELEKHTNEIASKLKKIGDELNVKHGKILQEAFTQELFSGSGLLASAYKTFFNFITPDIVSEDGEKEKTQRLVYLTKGIKQSLRGMGATLPLELNILTAFSSTYLVEEIKPKTELTAMALA